MQDPVILVVAGAITIGLSLGYLGIKALVKKLTKPKVFNLDLIDFTKSNGQLDKIEKQLKDNVDLHMKGLRTFYTITQCMNQSLEDTRLDDLHGTCQVIEELCKFNDINQVPNTIGIVNTARMTEDNDLKGYFEV